MNAAAGFAAVLVAAAAAVVAGPHRPRRDRARVDRARVTRRAARESDERSERRTAPTRHTTLAAAAAVLAGIATAWLVAGLSGLVVGSVVAAGCYRVLIRLEPAEAARERHQAIEELPFALDLVGAALRAGAPVDRALLAVGRALDSPLGRRLGDVGRAYRLGAPADLAWQPLADLDGAKALVAAVTRATQSGAALAGACARLAATLREGADARSDSAAQRAGVLIVLPLGLCFLPAFVLVGVVPIVVGVLDDVLA
jgi:pilus assembly protein TadC